MTKMQAAPVTGFTSGERDYIRRELDMFFSTLPTVAEGFQLKTWRGGPEAGKPKLSPIAKGPLNAHADLSPEPGDGPLQSGDISGLTATLPLRLNAENRHAIGATFQETVHAANPRSAVEA